MTDTNLKQVEEALGGMLLLAQSDSSKEVHELFIRRAESALTTLRELENKVLVDGELLSRILKEWQSTEGIAHGTISDIAEVMGMVYPAGRTDVKSITIQEAYLQRRERE